jgi:hypothetical protein
MHRNRRFLGLVLAVAAAAPVAAGCSSDAAGSESVVRSPRRVAEREVREQLHEDAPLPVSPESIDHATGFGAP